MSRVRCDPGRVVQFTQDQLPWRFDFTNLLGDGESIQSATATLIDTTTRMTHAAGLDGSPVVASPYVTQIVTGLVARHRYRLEVVGTVSATKVWEMPLDIEVPS